MHLEDQLESISNKASMMVELVLQEQTGDELDQLPAGQCSHERAFSIDEIAFNLGYVAQFS